MASDVIRCPGCGVNMDLSAFRTRPEQVVCPRCHTRSVVPPALHDTQVNESMNGASSYPASQLAAHQLQGTMAQPYAPQNVQGISQTYIAPQTGFAYPQPQFQPAPRVEGTVRSYPYSPDPAQQHMPMRQVPYSQQMPMPYPIPLQQGLPLQQIPLQQPVPSLQQIPLQQVPMQQMPTQAGSIQEVPETQEDEKNGQVQHPIPIMPEQYLNEDAPRVQQFSPYSQYEVLCPPLYPLYQQEQIGYGYGEPTYGLSNAYYPYGQPYYIQQLAIPQQGEGGRGQQDQAYVQTQPTYQSEQIYDQEISGQEVYQQNYAALSQDQMLYQDDQVNLESEVSPYAQEDAYCIQDQYADSADGAFVQSELYEVDQNSDAMQEAAAIASREQSLDMHPQDEQPDDQFHDGETIDTDELVISDEDYQQVRSNDQTQVALEESWIDAPEATFESEGLASDLVSEYVPLSEDSTSFDIDEDANIDHKEQIEESFDDANGHADDTIQDDSAVDEVEQHDELPDTPAAIEPIMPLTDDIVYVDEQIEIAQSHDYSADSDSSQFVQEQEEDSIIFDLEKSEIVEPIKESIQEGSDTHDGSFVSKTMELEQIGAISSEAQGPTSDEGMFLLPIDKKGNAEPLAFAVIGLLSIVLMMPFIGIILCIIALVMRAHEKKLNLHNAYRGATLFFAIVGLILNIALLGIMATAVVYAIMSPSALLVLL